MAQKKSPYEQALEKAKTVAAQRKSSVEQYAPAGDYQRNFSPNGTAYEDAVKKYHMLTGGYMPKSYLGRTQQQTGAAMRTAAQRYRQQVAEAQRVAVQRPTLGQNLKSHYLTNQPFLQSREKVRQEAMSRKRNQESGAFDRDEWVAQGQAPNMSTSFLQNYLARTREVNEQARMTQNPAGAARELRAEYQTRLNDYDAAQQEAMRQPLDIGGGATLQPMATRDATGERAALQGKLDYYTARDDTVAIDEDSYQRYYTALRNIQERHPTQEDLANAAELESRYGVRNLTEWNAWREEHPTLVQEQSSYAADRQSYETAQGRKTELEEQRTDVDGRMATAQSIAQKLARGERLSGEEREMANIAQVRYGGMDAYMQELEAQQSELNAEIANEDEILSRYGYTAGVEEQAAASRYGMQTAQAELDRRGLFEGLQQETRDGMTAQEYADLGSYKQDGLSYTDAADAITGTLSREAREPGKQLYTWINDATYRDYVRISYWEEKGYDLLTTEEKQEYNARYHKDGADAAQAFLDAMQPVLQERRGLAKAGYWQDVGYDLPIMSTMASVGTQLVSGMTAPIVEGATAIAGALGTPIDPNSSLYDIAKVGPTLRGGVAQTLAEQFPFDLPGTDTNAGAFLYNALMSGLDSVTAWQTSAGIAELMGKGTGLAKAAMQTIMSNEAAVSTMVERLQSGDSVEEALAMGAIDGLIEAATETWSIEAIFSDPTNFTRYLVQNFLAEGSEEVAGDVLNALVDLGRSGITGRETELRQTMDRYIAQGMSEKEAERRTLEAWVQDTLLDGLAGAISGVGIAGAGAAVNKVETRQSQRVMEQHGVDRQTARLAAQELGGMIKPEGGEQALQEARTQLEESADTRGERKTPFAAKAEAKDMKDVKLEVTGIAEVDEDGHAKVTARDAVEDAQGEESQQKKEMTLPLSEVTFSDADTKKAYENAAKLGDTVTARQYLTGFEASGLPLAIYDRAFRSAFDAGKNSRALSHYEQTQGYASMLEEPVRQIAYKAGQAWTEAQNARMQLPSEIEGEMRERLAALPRTYEKGYTGVVYAAKTTRPTAAQAVMLDLMDSYAKKQGIHYTVVDTLGGGSNGVYSAGDGMVIALDAQEGYLTRTATHEGWHYIREQMGTEANALQDVVLEMLKTTEGYDLETRVAEKQAQYKEAIGQELSRENALEELTADALYDAISTPDGMASLLQKHEGVVKRMLDKVAEFIGNFLREAKDMMRRIAGKNPEARAMLQYETEWGQTILDEYNRLMREAGTKERQKKGGKQERHSLRDEAEALVDENGDVVVKTDEEFEAALHNPNWSYRGYKSSTPLSDWGTAMFTDNAEEAYFDSEAIENYKQYAAKGWFVRHEDLTDINELKEEIWEKWKEDWENGDLQDKYEITYLEEDRALDKEEILTQFDPPDIVDAALAYDNFEFQKWLWERVIEPKDIAGVKTSDGAFVYDRGIIHRIYAEDADGTRYSLRDVEQDAEEIKRVLEENEQLVKLVGSLNQQMKAMSGMRKVDEKAVRSLARELKAAYESKVSVSTLAQNLQTAFDQMANAKTDTEGKAAMTAMGAIARDMLEKSERVDTTVYDEYKGMREYLRKTPMALTPAQWAEAVSLYGSERAFRNAAMGRWRIAAKNSDAATLDSYWGEMAEQWPEMFNADANEGDQVSEVMRALQSTTKWVQNPYEMNLDQMTQDVTAEIYDKYLATPTNRDNETRTMQRLMAERDEAKVETEAAHRREEDLKLYWENQAAEIRRLRAELKNARTAAREQTRQWSERRAEMDQMRSMRKEIIRQKGRILKKLQAPRVGSFVPYQMQDAVVKLLDVLGGDDSQVQKQQVLTKELLEKARDAYEAVLKPVSADGKELSPLADFYSGDLADVFDRLAETANGKRLNSLNREETEQLRQIVNSYAAMIINEDRLFTQSKRESLQKAGDALQARMAGMKEKGIQSKTYKLFADALSRGLLTPTTVFGLFEGTELEPVWRALRNAEWTHIRNVQKAAEYMQEMLEKYGEQDEINMSQVAQLKGKLQKDGKRHGGGVTVEALGGREMHMTREEAMTIYATAKREKMIGTRHLLDGGVVFEHTEGRAGQSTAAYKLDESVIDAIGKSLTAEQRDYVDQMVRYLSEDVAEWGNAVTREMYGVEKFKETYYIPLSVDKNSLKVDPAQSQENRLKFGSFTNAIRKKADSPITIVPFTELWARHVEQMSDYNAFVLPIEDMTRLINYRGDGGSMKASMLRAYGPQVTDYISSFLRRLNGNGKAEHGGSWLNKFISMSKGAAVTFNLSVAIQQAGAGPRAMAEIAPKYVWQGIVSGFRKIPHLSEAYTEIEEHAPIAVEKGWGYFDTNMTRGLYDRARETTKGKLDDIGGFLAEKGDQLNWVQIWDAVKTETEAETRLEVGSPEYWQRCADRFTEVVDKTQVVDSIFQRAEWATEKGAIKQSMNFLSEPIKQYNMLWRGLHTIWEGKQTGDAAQVARGVKELGRNAGGIAISAVATAALKSIITAMRDRDNDKKEEDEDGKSVVVGVRNFGDKYLDAILPNLRDNLTGLLPVFSTMISDAFSSGYGQGSSTLENTILTNTGRAWQYLKKGEYERAFYYAMQAGSNATGVGIGNGYRDARALILTASDAVTRDTLAGTAWDKSKSLDVRLKAATHNYVFKREKDANGNYMDSRKAAPALYYDLMLTTYFESGMGEDFQRVVQAALDTGATETGLMTGFKTRLRNASDAVTAGAEAYHKGDMDEANRQVEEIVKGGVGTKAAYSMIEAKAKELYPEEKTKEEGKAENVVEGLREAAKSGMTVTDTRQWSEAKEKARTGDKDAIAQMKGMLDALRKSGVAESELTQRVWRLYGADYKAAVWRGDAEEVKTLEAAMMGMNVGLTRDALQEKMIDASKDALYTALRGGDVDTARSMKTYLQKAMGNDAYIQTIGKWAKSAYRKAMKEGNGETLRQALKALGFSDATLAGYLK